MLVRTIDLGYAITHMATHSSIKGKVCVILRKPRHSAGSKQNHDATPSRGPCNSIAQIVSLATVSTRSGARSMAPATNIRIGKTRHASDMAISADGQYIVVVGKRKIHVASLREPKKGFTKILTDAALTCVAFHPKENAFATGDESGKIRLWYFLQDPSQLSHSTTQERLAPSTVLHWHAHAVSSLRFTDNGANLLSGGEESVLVLWQLATHGREFVPRLGGGTLVSISTLPGKQGRQEQFVVAMDDGSVCFIGTINLKPLRTIAGVLASMGQNSSSAYAFPMASQPSTGNLVLPAGHPSSLQFVDATTDQQVMQLEVIASNRVSRPDDTPLSQPHVEHVAFSSDANWMATVDRRAAGEIALKVWRRDSTSNVYTLNTRIDEPHGAGQSITSIGFSPRSYSTIGSVLLLSTGSDGNCKLWRHAFRNGKKQQKHVFWIARSAFEHRAMPAYSHAWSADGSLLAIAHGAVVTLWEPLSNVFLHAITSSSTSSDTDMNTGTVQFVGSGSRYVASTEGTFLSVWDVVLGKHVVERPLRNIVAILDLEVSTSTFVVITATSSESKVIRLHLNESTSSIVQSIPFGIKQIALGTNKALDFYALTNEDNVLRISAAIGESGPGEAAQSLRSVVIKRRTLYDELFGTSHEQETHDQDPGPDALHVPSVPARSADIQSLFDVPAHLLPPVQTLFEPFMQRLLPRRPDDVEELAPSSEEHGSAEVTEADAKPIMNHGLFTLEQRMAHVAALDMDNVTQLFYEMATGQEPEDAHEPAAEHPPITANDTPAPAHDESTKHKTRRVSNGMNHVDDHKRSKKASVSHNHSSPHQLGGKKRKSSSS